MADAVKAVCATVVDVTHCRWGKECLLFLLKLSMYCTITQCEHNSTYYA
jgi:hypothetical protein